MKRFVTALYLLSAISVRAEFGLVKSTELNVKPSDVKAASGWVTGSTYQENASTSCRVDSKNPVSGAPFSITFGPSQDGYTDCMTSLVAFNGLGEAVFLDSSRFAFYSDSYKRPERVNRVSFYDKNGALEVTHHLPPFTSVFSGSYRNGYKVFNASGVLAFALQRQREVPASQRDSFRNSLDADGQFPVTTEVVLATATKSSGVRIVENSAICGSIGCTSLEVIAALDNGKIWISLYRVKANADAEAVIGWVDSKTGEFTHVILPSLGERFDDAILDSVNERGDLLISALPKARFNILSGRRHVFLVDAQNGAAQDLSCQIEYGESDNAGLIFQSEDAIELLSVSRRNLSFSDASDIYTSQLFVRSAPLKPSRCVQLELKLERGCQKLLHSNVRAKMQEQSKRVASLKTEDYQCSGSIRALEYDGKVVKGAAFVLQTYSEKAKIDNNYAIRSSREYRGYRWLKSDNKGAAHFSIRVPSFKNSDMFLVDIVGPLREGISVEQTNYSFDSKVVR